MSRFDTIGSSYEKALAKYPKARLDHVWLLRNSCINSKSHVLEISGGTGFLTEKIAEIVKEGKIIVQDVSPIVLKINSNKRCDQNNLEYVVESDMNFPSLDNDTFDSVIGLGGFHHIEDQVTFFSSIYKKLKKGGVVCMGDFEDNSSMQRYFDEKIHYITPTGHQGLFASESRFINLARFAGFDKVKVERIKTPFCFHNEEEIGDFFQLVHDLDQNPQDTYNDIKKYFTIIENHDSKMVILDYVYACFQK
jgi:ubiquinone/menaquinone biosynthesis C-methylase UbiE